MFLQRNLSYMSGKKCTQQRKKAAFSWDAWLTQIKFRDNSQPSYTESLVLQFLGYMDEKNVEASAVNVDIHLMQNKNNNEKQKQMVNIASIRFHCISNKFVCVCYCSYIRLRWM